MAGTSDTDVMSLYTVERAASRLIGHRSPERVSILHNLLPPKSKSLPREVRIHQHDGTGDSWPLQYEERNSCREFVSLCLCLCMLHTLHTKSLTFIDNIMTIQIHITRPQAWFPVHKVPNTGLPSPFTKIKGFVSYKSPSQEHTTLCLLVYIAEHSLCRGHQIT